MTSITYLRDRAKNLSVRQRTVTGSTRWKAEWLPTERKDNSDILRFMWEMGSLTTTYLCLGCKVPDLIFSSSSRRRTSSSWMRGLGAGLGGMVGSWMNGWDGSTLFRNWAPTHGCVDPDRSPELRRDPSWPVALLDPAVLLKQRQGSFLNIHRPVTGGKTFQGRWYFSAFL